MNVNYLPVPYDQTQRDLDRYYAYGNDLKTRYQHRQRINNIENIINKLGICNTDRTLDVGCGRGFYLTLLAQKSQNVIGVEFSREGIDGCRAIVIEKGLKDRIQALRGDALNLPFQENTFDFILCTEVLEHLADPLKGALEIHRVLKLGGKALISMPNLFSIFWLFNRAIAEASGLTAGSTEIDPHMKFPFFKMESMLRNAGFDVKAVRGTYMIPSDLLFRVFPNSRNAARLVHALGWIEWNLNIKPLNAFFFVSAIKKTKKGGEVQ
ncbi:MAG: class I SAM-dependent methyltransferase [Methanothrix sp.]